jgi:hypothetical protein
MRTHPLMSVPSVPDKWAADHVPYQMVPSSFRRRSTVSTEQGCSSDLSRGPPQSHAVAVPGLTRAPPECPALQA